MNEKSLRVIEWPKIKQLLAEQTSFSLGTKRAEEITPMTDLESVQAALDLTSKALALLWKAGEPPFGGATDISATVHRAEIGGILEGEELLQVTALQYCVQRMIKYLRQEQEGWSGFVQGLSPLSELYNEVMRCISDEGMVKDLASPELGRIRQKMRSLANRVREKLESIVHSSSTQKVLQEAIITIRNGRYVVPVKSEFKGHFSGIVHDQSASGATLFMEPAVVVEINNQLRVAEKEEEAEVQRILRRLSGLVKDDGYELLSNLQIIADLDFQFAKAKLSKKFGGTEPVINNEGIVHIRQGRHPLLSGDVVPVNIWIGDEFRILVITGPNTGGKTVTLKTVGLFCVMAQSGLHIPALEGSKVALFEGIYADIGDEQSIEQSLSTFSSHMVNIVSVLKQANERSLVLLDELGAGTDPTEGAALATAILQNLRERRITTIATTHYSELKSFAYAHDDVENASVEFDITTLRPTYHLSIGIPGKSNAFAISLRLGLMPDIVEGAKAMLSSDQLHVEDMIGEIERNQRNAERARREAESLRSEYQVLKGKYEHRINSIEELKAAVLAEANLEAERLLAKTRQEMDLLIGELRKENRDDLERLAKEQREKLQARQTELKAVRPVDPKADQGPKGLKPGEEVRIKSLRQDAIVVHEPNDNGEVLVQAGIMKITIKLHDLERIESKPAVFRSSRFAGGIGKTKSISIRSELDIRGKTVEESLDLVDKYLDDAFLSSLARVRIIHGKGTGVLRDAIQQQLKTHPHVKTVRFGEPSEGGNGVSVAELDQVN